MGITKVQQQIFVHTLSLNSDSIKNKNKQTQLNKQTDT